MGVLASKILTLDRFLLSVVVSRRKLNLTTMMVLLSRIGDGYVWALTGILFLFFHPSGKRVFIHFVFAYLFELTAYKGAKYFLPRLRPCDMLPEITRLIIPPDQHSFPSGHTAAAFVMVFLIGMYVPPLLPLVIILSSGIAVSRIYLGVHYPSDILAGIGLGLLCGQLSYKVILVMVS